MIRVLRVVSANEGGSVFPLLQSKERWFLPVISLRLTRQLLFDDPSWKYASFTITDFSSWTILSGSNLAFAVISVTSSLTLPGYIDWFFWEHFYYNDAQAFFKIIFTTDSVSFEIVQPPIVPELPELLSTANSVSLTVWIPLPLLEVGCVIELQVLNRTIPPYDDEVNDSYEILSHSTVVEVFYQ